MYYQNYENYMRSVLGYPIESQNTYELYDYSEIPYEMSQMCATPARYSSEIMDLYPEIYKIVNPMVCKICETNTAPITRELVDKMTDEIYSNLEAHPYTNTVVNVKVNTSVSSERQEKNNRVSSDSSNSSSNRISKTKLDNNNGKVESSETRESVENREDRQLIQNNNTLRDLIRILILNQLLGGNFPNRPMRLPRPNRPPLRPPFPRNDAIYGLYQ